MQKIKGKIKYIISAIISLVLIVGIILSIVYIKDIRDFLYEDYRVATPVITAEKLNQENDDMIIGDFYVSTKGDDSNAGTADAPFKTIEKAIEAVRNTEKTGKKGITVCIEAGEYRVSSLNFTKEDSGTADCPVKYCAYNGEVILNGGVTLYPSTFKSPSEYPEVAERLNDNAKENVIVVDLTKAPYSLTKDDWGKIYAIGSYNTADKYDGDTEGPLHCELFVNDERQTIARYPDNDYLYTEEVVSTGEGKEANDTHIVREGWDELRNPKPDVYRVNEELAKRISKWQNPDDAWLFGYWMYDWADASSPLGSFNKETRELTPEFVSLYGTKTDAPYYFFNVLEELTVPGEWYLDRENGLLYLWKPDNFEEAVIDLSVATRPVINAEADNLVFDGFIVKGTRGDGVVITGDNNTFENCTIKNVAGNALIMTGCNNLAFNNEITRTGMGGIIINGGDTKTLTPGNSKADNNYIHDWSEIYLTYQPAVTLNGVGNTCSHNEMVNAPHEAITYSGNNHIIEYNLIHDVCLLSDDAGAIYAGRSWIWYGNVIRYNCIYNVGSGEHKPDGIYFDDALSGQTVYGNILLNIPRNAVHIGGGRDNTVYNNIIINTGKNAVYFDDRARDGALNNGWFTHSHIGSGDMWDALYDSPWQSAVWQNAFPQYKACSDDIADAESPSYIPNPSSMVKDNLIFDKNKDIGDVREDAYKFGDVSNNPIYSLHKMNDFFVSSDNGNYNLKNIDEVREIIPGFEEIPVDEIGRKVTE